MGNLILFRRDWGTETLPLVPKQSNLSIRIIPETGSEGDTVSVKFYYPNKKTDIKGLCVLGKNNVKSKRGTWTFYHENGNLWSERSYDKTNKLIAINALKSSTRQELEYGFVRSIGRSKRHFGKLLTQHPCSFFLGGLSPSPYTRWYRIKRRRIHEFTYSLYIRRI